MNSTKPPRSEGSSGATEGDLIKVAAGFCQLGDWLPRVGVPNSAKRAVYVADTRRRGLNPAESGDHGNLPGHDPGQRLATPESYVLAHPSATP